LAKTSVKNKGAYMTEETNPVGRPKLFKNAEELQAKIEAYFTKQNELQADMLEPMPIYTMAGLALALGVDRKTITNYSKDEEFFPAIKLARAKVEEMVEQRSLAGLGTAGAIFNLKNNFGWRDSRDIEHSGSVPMQIVFAEGDFEEDQD